ncbi:hypothetical protein O988_01116 [Pseudogymnoascus sp. VKM F-3808]|nr:hypothetical protein O988_01116 [Pseudogymnoascus sp. VKM F-3808]
MDTKPNETYTTPSDDEATTSRQRPAAQACETCRSRKVKCDEERPRCGVCQRLNIRCEYREPRPTKRDKTLVHVLNTLKNVEHKVDILVGATNSRSSSSPLASFSRPQYFKSPFQIPQVVDRLEGMTGESSSDSVSRLDTRTFPTPPVSTRAATVASADAPSTFPISHENNIEARKLIMWPTIRSLLKDELVPTSLLDSINDGGEKWLTKISNEFTSELPVDEPASFAFVGSSISSDWDPTALHLTRETVEELSQAFFRSFHCMYPILDSHHYYTVTLAQAYQCSFAEHDLSSTLVFLVLALGSVAQLGISGDSIQDDNGQPTGVRGGTPERPPGLAYLNEARRRLGFVMTRMNFTVLHCLILLSLYYAQVSRNLDHWRMAEMSSLMCRNLVKTVEDWKTFEGDIIARAYWMCVLLEGGLATELGMPRTGIAGLESVVPLPLFLSDNLREPFSTEALIVKYHFLAQITLRAIINRIDSSLGMFQNPLQSDHADGSPHRKVIHELLRQLSEWRENLPSPIYWAETSMKPENVASFWEPSRICLRTRFKYAHTTEEDMMGTNEAFKACVLWPLTHSIFDDQRRLVPHIYEYSHTMFGILMLLHALKRVPILKDWFESIALHEGLEKTRTRLLGWLRSMRVVHPVAAWYWAIVRVLYREHEVVLGA